VDMGNILECPCCCSEQPIKHKRKNELKLAFVEETENAEPSEYAPSPVTYGSKIPYGLYDDTEVESLEKSKMTKRQLTFVEDPENVEPSESAQSPVTYGSEIAYGLYDDAEAELRRTKQMSSQIFSRSRATNETMDPPFKDLS